MPMLRRCGGMATTDLPSMAMSPPVGVSKPAIIIKVVVLPDPLGPSSVRNSPEIDVERNAGHRGHAIEALFQVAERDLRAAASPGHRRQLNSHLLKRPTTVSRLSIHQS